MNQQQLETLFEFPCQFPIKVMGLAVEDLEAIVLESLKEAGVDTQSITVQVRPSKDDKYISITAVFEATSKEQLNQLYQCLTNHPAVKIVL